MSNDEIENANGGTAQTSGPFPERSPGAPLDADQPPDVEALFVQAKTSLTALRGRGRTRDGRAGPGNLLRLKHGLDSRQLLDVPAVAAWHAEQVDAITRDLGGEDALSTLARSLVREAARLEVLTASMGDDLLRLGVLTGKGKARSMALLYLQVLDRFTRLTATLGLERKARPVNPLDAVQQAVQDANRDDAL